MGDFGIPVATDNSLADGSNPETTSFRRFITSTFLFQCVGNIFNVAEIGRIWARQYPRVVAFAEQGGGDLLPRSALNFIIKLLLALTQMKAQSLSGFPFTTHHRFMTVSATTILLYAFISAVEKVVISFAGCDRTSFSMVVARLGKIGCLWTFAASLAALLYL